jgi:hypothetical protein
MKSSRLLSVLSLIGFTAFASSLASAQSLIYGLTANNSLVRFSATGGVVTPGPGFTGLGVGESVVGIDFRPLTGALYALSRDGGGVGRL